MERKKLDMDMQMDVVYTNGVYGLYNDARYSDAEGFCRYEVHDYWGSISDFVIADFAGTIFTKKPLPPKKRWRTAEDFKDSWYGFDETDEDDGFCGFRMTPREFLDADEEFLETQERADCRMR